MLRTLLILLVFTIVISSQTNKTADSILALHKITDDSEAKQRLEESLIFLMYTATNDDARQLSDKLLKLSANLPDKSLYIKVLIHSYRFHGFDEKMRMLNLAIELISESGNPELLPHAYIFKAIAFRDNSIADSAMIYALKAKDILENSGKREDLFAPMQLVADMHYYAGEYNQAKKLYLKLKKLYPESEVNFNYRIIENNLGLVELGLGNYQNAERHFLNSVEHLKSKTAIYADSSGLPYIFRKLMETNILLGDVERAEKFCDSGISLANYYRTFGELSGLYSGKGVILLKKGRPEESLGYLNKAEELEAKYPDLKYKIDLYKAFSETWTALGNYKEANKYLNLYTVERSKADSLFNSSKIMYLLAEHNYVLAVRHIEGLERERLLYIIILAILVSSMVILYLYYTRLKRANKILVEKNLQIAYSFGDGESDSTKFLQIPTTVDEDFSKFEIEERKQKEVDNDKLVQIADNLDQLIVRKKVYLDPDLTIVSLAEMLGTNRTYLVKAIKKKHEMNFLDFINGHRVAAAIRLLDSERAKNLTIDGIAGLAGFNNRVTFAKIFKQSTGMSPSVFMKSVSEISKHSGKEKVSNSDDNDT